MCLIIAKNNQTAIPTEYIEIAAENNPDGFGLIGKTIEGDIYTAKSLKMAEALPTIRQFEKECASLVAHFRWATHGEINDANTHPFQLAGENYLTHNGIVNVPITNKNFSDTWHLVETMRSAIKTLNVPSVTSFFEQTTGLGGSKFVLLGEVLPLTIINETAGTRRDNIWYSNSDSFSRFNWDYAEAASYETAYEAISLGYYTLEDIAMLDHQILAKLCKALPHEIADIIADGAYYMAEDYDEREYQA